MSVNISNHSVHPVSQSDLPILADLLRASKLSLSINRLLFKDWPNEAAQSVQYTRAIEGAFPNPDSEMLKVVDDGTGEIVGHLVLTHTKPATQKAEPIENATEEKPEVPEGMVPEVFFEVIKAPTETKRAVNGVEHLALTHIYVKPSSRNKGVGSGLVQLALQRGKAMGLPVFVGSEPQALQFFHGLGFRVTGYFDIDLSKFAPANCGFGVFRLSGMMFNSWNE